MTIHDISDDSLKHILSFLTQSDLLKTRLCSQRFEREVLNLLKMQELKLKLTGLYSETCHTFALMEDRLGRQQLFSWGQNDRGQLGLGHDDDVNTPQPLDMSFLNGAKIKNFINNYFPS